MKNLLLTLFIFAFFIPLLNAQQNANGGEWTIVETFETPGKASGLAWDGTYIYFGIYGAGGDEFYRLDPATGESTLLFTHPEVDDSFGMTWDGEYLWTVHQPSGSSNPALATQLDLEGNTISTIALPDHYMSGIAYDEGNFWVCTYYENPGMVYKIDDQGNVLESFAPPVYDQLWDVCRQDDFLWFADYDGDVVYKTDLTGALLEEHPAENIKPAGIVWDGAFLWYVDGQLSSPSTIYKVDLGGAGTPEIQVPVTSWDFGNVALGDAETWDITVNNIGNADLELQNLVIPGAVPIFSYETFPQTIEPGGTAGLEVIFEPSEVGTLNTTVVLQSSDPVNPEVELVLTGEAVISGPSIHVQATSHDYNEVRAGAYTRWDMPVENIGDETLTIESVTSSDEAFIVDESIQFPVSVSPLEVVHLGIWFHPTDAETYEGMLEVNSNDPQNPAVEVTVTGEGHVQDYLMGDQMWYYDITTGYDPSPKAIGPLKDITGDGVNEVIVCSEDNFVRCFNGNSNGIADVMWEHEIYSGNVYQGEALSFLPDINGDTYDEVVVGTTGGDRSVVCLSGKTGEQLWKFQTSTWGDGGWVYETDASRDFTGDDIPDVLACAGGSSTGPGADRVFCLNGTDGTLEWDYFFNGPGFSVMAIDDVNGDGVPEALSGASNSDESQGKTVVVDGSTGYEIWTNLAGGTSVWALVQLDDINGDGVRDVASGEFGNGEYKVFDATNGDELFDGSIGGGFVIITDLIRLDDVNADGYADFTIQSSSGNCVVIDGHEGENIWFTPLADQAQKVDRIADVSGDAINDVVVGTLFQNNYVYFLDGATGDILEEVAYGEPVDGMSAIQDINGDISWEVVAGGREGKVTCYSGGINAYTALPESSPVQEFLHIEASPNPFVDHCKISIKSGETLEGNLSVYTAGGRLVKDFGHVKVDQDIEISLNDLQQNGAQLDSGFYFVIFSGDGFAKTAKIVKQ